MRPRPARLALALVLLATLATLGVGFALKDACNHRAWDGGQYRGLCYNDIAALYDGRHFDRGGFPYVDHAGDDPQAPLTEREGFLEYPVVTGLFMWYAARLAHLAAAPDAATAAGFFYANAALLSALAVGTTLLLWRLAPDRRRLAYWAAGSPLALYAFHNWDLLAVFLVALGLHLHLRGRQGWSGLAFALAASAKMYPLLVPPLLWVLLVRADYAPPPPGAARLGAMWDAAARCRPAWLLTAGTVGGLALVNVPFLLFGNAQLWLETYRFHARRGPNFETVWWAAQHYGHRWDAAWLVELGGRAWVESAGLLLLVGAYAALAVWAWRRRPHAAAVALAPILVFMLLNKIFSVQYALWVLPFFALLRLPAWSYAAYAAADAWVHVTVFPLFLRWGQIEGSLDADYPWLAVAVVARHATLVALLVLVVRGARGARPPAGTERRSYGGRTAPELG